MKQSTLADEVWTPSSEPAVVLSFLRSEWNKWPRLSVRDKRLISDARITDGPQNKQRLSLLWSVRGDLLRQIPADTEWFEVKSLRGRHFEQLYAINFGDWSSSEDRNELEKVALRKPLQWRGPVGGWEPILWGHDKNGPFTTLEGNHRLSALAGSPERGNFELVVYVGLSPSRCIWHRPDAVLAAETSAVHDRP